MALCINTLTTATVCVGLLLIESIVYPSSQSAWSQSITKQSTESSGWFTAPREFQIVDDRPVVRNFQEPPQSEQDIDLPSIILLGGPGFGGRGAGSLDGRGSATIPAGGLRLADAGLGYCAARHHNLAEPPKSGFGRESNVVWCTGSAAPTGQGAANRAIGKLLSTTPGYITGSSVAPNVQAIKMRNSSDANALGGCGVRRRGELLNHKLH
jgi:hypothetical protein